MKNKIHLFVALALAVCAVPLTTTSCSMPVSSSTQSAVYKTLASIGESVDVAMTQAAQAQVSHRISDQQWNEISKVHADYIVAYRTAVDAGATAASPAPAKLIALAAQISALLASYLPTPV